MIFLRSRLSDLVSLFYPELCAGCGTELLRGEEVICAACIYKLPVTNFHQDGRNLMTRQLGGRFPFLQASAFVHFRKGGLVQQMMHELKYRNRPDVGEKLGRLYAYQLSNQPDWLPPDIIVPVPLHHVRLRQRGYNQAERFGWGLSEITGIPMQQQYLLRTRNTGTQTKRSRFSRYENLRSSFRCRNTGHWRGKHILVVDDIMTTGATIEACCELILKIPETSVSIATIAFTE